MVNTGLFCSLLPQSFKKSVDDRSGILGCQICAFQIWDHGIILYVHLANLINFSSMNLSDLTEAEFSVIEKLFGDWFFFFSYLLLPVVIKENSTRSRFCLHSFLKLNHFKKGNRHKYVLEALRRQYWRILVIYFYPAGFVHITSSLRKPLMETLRLSEECLFFLFYSS